jgi:hypothetical protein
MHAPGLHFLLLWPLQSFPSTSRTVLDPCEKILYVWSCLLRSFTFRYKLLGF